ncbi:hypothetical protein D9V41_13015 [Aeromicrobium phragmitis]|uniref:Sortase n=1 Tax=Aeromicrobium phragmitis TaxID=2478914 RepID=A0A3L8PJX8_9ACTN|nr:hypothetical protein [Aeromicrobium phragmitis]RLV55013.1 hypothetical protein D9V41_13015 [Aeromicrobium phragmitis]
MTVTEVLRRHRFWSAGAALVVLVAAGVLVAALAGVFDSPKDAEPDAAPATAQMQTPNEEPAPAVNIETTETMPYSPVWNPPDQGENFWQVVDPENGYPEDGGTDFILAHACEDHGCAGDQIRALQTGDDFTYRGETYRVEEKIEIPKTEIADQDIWVHDPDRVVVITCILDAATGEYHENDIIVANRLV